MRPVRLVVEGFGSFAERQVIDFSELAERRLFLIHGPTGSGKTTILDAICFALYGDTTGGERDGKGMRSDFVGPEVDTEVTLDFEVGTKAYRVSRQPAYERAKLRGEGTTRTPGGAELWDRTGAASQESEGELLASGLSNVTAAVEQVLGFRSEQFRQVIVLPQGQFRDLLLAKSKEREDILQQLFDTSFYARIQDELNARRKLLQRQADTLRTRRATLLEHVGGDDEDALRGQAEQLEAERDAADRKVVTLEKKATTAAKALERAVADNQKFHKIEQAEAALHALLDQRDGITQDKKRLEAARRADRLEDVAESLAERREAADEAGKLARQADADSQAADETLKSASRALEAAEGREPDRKILADKLTEMRRVRPIVEDLAAAEAARDKARNAYEEAAERLKADEAGASELEDTIEQTEAAVATAQDALGDRGALAAALDKAEKALAGRKALDEQLDEERALKADKVAAEKAVEAAKKGVAQAKAGLDKLVKAREAASAALLAKELEPGEPCPVCGSKKHPALAKSRRKVPAEDEVAAAQAEVEAAELELEEAREALDEANGGLAGLGGEVRAIKKALGKATSAKFSDLEKERAAAAAALTQHDRDSVQLERNRQNLREDKKSLKILRAQVEKARKGVEGLAKKLATAEAALSARKEQVPDEWRDLRQLDRAIRTAETEYEGLQANLKAAVEAEKKARQEATHRASELKSAAKQRDGAARALEKATAEWVKRLAAAGFPTEREYREALLPDVEMDDIQARIERYEHDLVAAETTANNARSAVEGLKRPDMEALQAAADEAEGARSQAANERARLANRLEELGKTLKSLELLAAELAEVEHRFGVMGHIANVANGDNKHRISLQRFVLASRLDDVLASASKRLGIMSRGRYLLRRSTSAEDRRAAGGLELEIEDAYTAKSRPVATLSGGESFQAALSLALGLSEVVQAYAGGIRLDTIFVDEGFGSLDPEALDLAINTLIDLQQSGRMVGVISHVPELRERIDVRLEVTAGKTGSRAQFRLP